MTISIYIPSAILYGALVGAATAAVVIAVLSFLGAVVSDFISLGAENTFWATLLKGCLIYVPIGAVSGGLFSLFAPAWLIVVLVLAAFYLTALASKRSRRYA